MCGCCFYPSWWSDAFILCSIGQSIASCRLLSTVDLLASCLLRWGCLNVGGLETVDILFTLVQQMNRNRAGPFFAWVAVICIWERETDRKIKTVCETQTGLILLYYLGLWDLTGLDKSERVSEKEIHRTRRCTDSSLHAGTVFSSSDSMQDVFHWLLIVTRPWHPGVLIGQGGDTEGDYIFTCEFNLGSNVQRHGWSPHHSFRFLFWRLSCFFWHLNLLPVIKEAVGFYVHFVILMCFIVRYVQVWQKRVWKKPTTPWISHPNSEKTRVELVAARGFHSWVQAANVAELLGWKQLSHPCDKRHWEHSWNSSELYILHRFKLSRSPSQDDTPSIWLLFADDYTDIWGILPIGQLSRGVLTSIKQI